MTLPQATSLQDLKEKEFLSPEEVERLYGFKKSTQAKWRMQGLIPFRKIGRFIRYNHAELKQWIDKGAIAQAEETKGNAFKNVKVDKTLRRKKQS